MVCRNPKAGWRIGGDWLIRRADELTQSYILPKCALPLEDTIEPESPLPGVSIDDWALFLGLYIAEGCSGKHKSRGVYNTILAQKKESKGYKEMEALCARFPYPHYKNPKGFVFSRKCIFSLVHPLGKSFEKYIPDYVWSWPKRLKEILWHGYWLGDGWSANGSIMAATVSEYLADDLMRLLMEIGVSSTLSVRTKSNDNWRDQYWIHKCKSSVAYLTNRKTRPATSKLDTVDYDGEMLCLTVPSGTLVVRRNGKPLVAGNCIRWLCGTSPRYLQPGGGMKSRYEHIGSYGER